MDGSSRMPLGSAAASPRIRPAAGQSGCRLAEREMQDRTLQGCANCHTNIAAQWERSAHAIAWTDPEFIRETEERSATIACRAMPRCRCWNSRPVNPPNFGMTTASSASSAVPATSWATPMRDRTRVRSVRILRLRTPCGYLARISAASATRPRRRSMPHCIRRRPLRTHAPSPTAHAHLPRAVDTGARALLLIPNGPCTTTRFPCGAPSSRPAPSKSAGPRPPLPRASRSKSPLHSPIAVQAIASPPANSATGNCALPWICWIATDGRLARPSKPSFPDRILALRRASLPPSNCPSQRRPAARSSAFASWSSG